MKSLLITGAECALARTVLRELASEFTIRAVDARFTTPLPEGIEAREGDLREPAFVAAALEGIETVMHLGAIAPDGPNDLDRLDQATRGTYVLITEAQKAGISKLVLGSTLSLYDSLPAHWNVSETWRPRPTPTLQDLCPWLAELCVREAIRGTSMQAVCLRFGQVVNSQEASALPYDPRWLHEEDAVEGIRRSLYLEMPPELDHRWLVFHITAAGIRAKIRAGSLGGNWIGYYPKHDFQERWATQTPVESAEPSTFATQSISSRPIRRVVIFGAGGPVAAALAQELANSYTLRLTDVRPIADIAAEGQPQSHGAPLPMSMDAPHECRVVDVSDPEQVADACEGMDAIINCTVVRADPVEAFRVNTLGAFNVMQAAIKHNIRRVVHTGPQMVDLVWNVGYGTEYDIPGDALPRPANNLYGMSKFLGQEICRVFAETYGLEAPVLLFCLFVNPETAHLGNLHPFSISWQDSARALRRALEVRSLPSPYEVMNVNADLPHGKFSNARAKMLLDWEPRDSLEHLWSQQS